MVEFALNELQKRKEDGLCGAELGVLWRVLPCEGCDRGCGHLAKVSPYKGLLGLCRDRLLERDKVCLKCGSETRLTIDHVTPLSKGGSNDYSNLQILCKKCNLSKGSDIADYRHSVETPSICDHSHIKLIWKKTRALSHCLKCGKLQPHTTMQPRTTMQMNVFDKVFDVEFVDYKRFFSRGETTTTVIFRVLEREYRYVYQVTPLSGLGFVYGEDGAEVYSPYRLIPGGSYLQEIGRRLSVESRNQTNKAK